MNIRASDIQHNPLKYSVMVLNCFITEMNFHIWWTPFTVNEIRLGVILEIYLWVGTQRCFLRNWTEEGRSTSYAGATDWIKNEMKKQAEYQNSSLWFLTVDETQQSSCSPLLPPRPPQCDGLCALKARAKWNHSFPEVLTQNTSWKVRSCYTTQELIFR